MRIASVVVFTWLAAAALHRASGQTVTANLSVGGRGPEAIVVNPNTNLIYVASADNDPSGGHLTVIDGTTNAVSYIHTANPLDPFQVSAAVNTITNKIYIASENAGEVTIIDGATNSTSAVGIAGPSAIGVNPVTNKIYVASEIGVILVIDGLTGRTTYLPFSGSSPFQAIAVNPNTNKIYITSFSQNKLTVLDGGTNSLATVSVGMSPTSIAVNPSTNKIYVVNSGSNDVTVIDGASNATSTVKVGLNPMAPTSQASGLTTVAVNTVTNKIYVADYNTNSVTVIDGSSNSTTTVAAGVNPGFVAVNSVTNQIYVTDFNSKDVTVIDGASNTTRRIVTGASPGALAVNPLTNKVYVANGDDNTVSVVDASTTIANAASFQSGPAAPNTILSLFGTNLSCGGDLQVLVNGEGSEVLGAVATQINFVVPQDVEIGSSATVQVLCDGNILWSSNIATAPVAPAIFTANQTGSGQGSILNQDFSVNGATSPAPRGSYISLYGTGFGILGSPGPDGLKRLIGRVTVFFSGGPVSATYAGEAPGYTLGLQQINVQIPQNLSPNPNVGIVVMIDQGATTPLGVTVAVD